VTRFGPGLVIAAAMQLGVATRALATTPVPATALDHILVGVPDLGAAVADMGRRTGVRPKLGGSHPGVGTRNALVSLGNGSYLELIGIDPAQKQDAFGKFVARLRRPTPLGWALRTRDISRLHKALAERRVRVEPITSGSRLRPDGRMLRWRNFEIGPEEDVSPFFIEWAKGGPHPSTDAPSGCRAERIVVGTRLKPNVRRALAIVGDNGVKQVPAPPGLHFVLRCRGGSMRF
jgi:hypothetical protein